MSDDVRINTKGLDQMIKALKTKQPKIQIGVLSGKISRNEAGQDNATIGAAHEYGTSQLPQRSFLRIPIATQLRRYLKEGNFLGEATLKKIVAEGNIKPWLNDVGMNAMWVVLDAFRTGGFGKWAAWKTPNYENNTGQILVDTQQLRNSIDWRIVD